MMEPEVGAPVKVDKRHWLHPNMIGKIDRYDKTGINHWWVRFPDGSEICLNELDFTVLAVAAA